MPHLSRGPLLHRGVILGVIVTIALLAFPGAARSATESHSSLVIVIDGLRPDYITREIMPQLTAWGETGVVAEAHHSVFPTVTRVNSASIATGTYPQIHGLLNNTIYLPGASADPIDTGDAAALMKAEAALGGKLLTVVSFGELMAAAGKKLLVTGSGTTGSAWLLNHKPAAGGTLLSSRNLVRPDSWREQVERTLGPPPPLTYPNRAANRWAIDAYLETGLKEIHPEVTFMWLTDPDGTGHRYGVGTPKTIEALRHVDDEFGRLIAILAERGLREQVNLFVTADHGFSTHGGPFNLTALLTARGLAAGIRIVGGEQIYVQSGGDEKIRQIVRVLQETPWVGALFTRARAPGEKDGFVPGTLSFDSIQHQHARSPDILVDANWSHAANEQGYAGRTTSGGVAGHGTSSPYDIRIRLLAAGPDLKRAARSEVPTSNIDLAVTLCHLHGLKPTPHMRGRVMTELLRGGPDPAAIPVQRSVHRVGAAIADGRYELELHQSSVGAADYIEYTQTKR